MALPQEIRVIQSSQRRIKLFVDFWNVVITARSQCKIFDIDILWNKLSEHIIAQTRHNYDDKTYGELAGCYVFGSVSRSNPEESRFIDRVLDKYGSSAGMFFHFSDRIQKQTSIRCKNCNDSIKTRSESGIDVLLSVEMIKHASMREHEYLCLVSSDRDFLPLLSYLRDQGQRVLHASTGIPDREMRSVTWAQLSLADNYPYLSRIAHDGYVVLTAPPYASELEEVFQASPVDRENLKVIDITQPDQISDKDLEFLMKNFSLYWREIDEEDKRFGSQKYISKGMKDFRDLIRNGSVFGNLPYIIKDGKCVLYANYDDRDYRWIKMANSNYSEDWGNLYRPR